MNENTRVYIEKNEYYNLVYEYFSTTISDVIISFLMNLHSGEPILIDKIMEDFHSGKNMFITGQAGTGKSELLKTFYNESLGNKKIALTSTTGISAFNIGGVTLHSYLGIGLGTSSVFYLETKIKKSQFYRTRWRTLDTLVIDEISMMSPELFDKLEELARKVRKSEKPFGGIQVILSGDLLQLPCVKSDKFCFEAKSWSKVIENVYILSHIYRQTDIRFQTCLNEIRLGDPSDETIAILKSCIDKKLEGIEGIKPTRIFPTNYEADNLNETELDKLDGEYREYDMSIRVHSTKNIDIERYIKNIKAPRNLILCEGAQVVLLWNIDVLGGLVNGSRGVITGFTEEDLPIVKFINGCVMTMTDKIWTIMEGDIEIISFEQIPLKLAWATTIHSSQGLTLDYLELSLENIFEFGQFYVAISRAKNLEGLKILSDFSRKRVMAHPDSLKYYRDCKQYYSL